MTIHDTPADVEALVDRLTRRLDRARGLGSDLVKAVGLAELCVAAGDVVEASAFLTQAMSLARTVANLQPHGPAGTGGQRALFDPVVVTPPPLLVDRLDDATIGRAHSDGPGTETVAALANRAWSGSQRRRVLEAIAAAEQAGRTDFELERELNLNRPSPGNRRGELVRLGLVADTGERRPTATGCPAVVWAVTPLGTSVLLEARRLADMRSAGEL